MVGQAVAAGQRDTCEPLEPHGRGPFPQSLPAATAHTPLLAASPLLFTQELHCVEKEQEVLLGLQVILPGQELVCEELL